jgi:RND family efflux transporter MFP subunit
MRNGIVASFVMASIAGGCTAAREPVKDAVPAAVTVQVARVAVGDVSSPSEAGGIVRARTTAAIASRIMAPVAAVHVRAGDRVRRGQPVVTLDAREIRANNARAIAAAAAAEEAVRAAEADTRAAEAGSKLARVTYDRIKGLSDRQSATAQELDQAAAAADAADGQLTGTRARAASAAASRDAANAAVQAAGVSVTYTVLSAPFDGVVTERSTDPGSMAVPGAPLLTIEDAGAFRLEVPLDEANAFHVDVGGTVDVRVDALGSWMPARVTEVARVDPASHSFLLRIDLPGDPRLRSGLFGRARFPGPPRRALTVPASAVFRRGQLTFVWTVDREDTARLRPITVGVTAGDRVEALAGVGDGDRVVLDPPASLSDGGRIVPGPRGVALDRGGERR